MFFTDAIAELGHGDWKISEKDSLVYEISIKHFKIQFYPGKTKLILNETEYDIALTDFAKVKFIDNETKNDSGETVITTSLEFDGKIFFELPENLMSNYKKIFEALSERFINDDMTPQNQVEAMIDEFMLDEKSTYNPDLYKLLLIYKDKMEIILNNGFLIENSKILFLLEEGSGKISENLGQTLKKNIGKALTGGGFRGLLGLGMGMAKAAGARVAKDFVNDVTESKSFMILTNKNVILVKPEEVNGYDFDEASEIFRAQQDETFAGVIDVFDDSENKVLDNIAQIKWNSFKNLLRKIKKEAEQIGFDGGSGNIADEDDDGFAEAEKKITKLKKMFDSGLITQEEFDSKRAEILSSI